MLSSGVMASGILVGMSLKGPLQLNNQHELSSSPQGDGSPQGAVVTSCFRTPVK